MELEDLESLSLFIKRGRLEEVLENYLTKDQIAWIRESVEFMVEYALAIEKTDTRAVIEPYVYF